MRWTARSVMPTAAATSRSRWFGSAARQSSTLAWLVRKVQSLTLASTRRVASTALRRHAPTLEGPALSDEEYATNVADRGPAGACGSPAPHSLEDGRRAAVGRSPLGDNHGSGGPAAMIRRAKSAIRAPGEGEC